MGKCPKCTQLIRSVVIEYVDVVEGLMPKWKGVSYLCPNPACRVVLGVSIDPIAIKTDIVDNIIERLGR